MELSVQNVYGLLLRSKLLSLDDAKKMYERWQAEAKDAAGNVAQFARWMVANQYLTDYQASLLARGHADCFYLGQYKVLDKLGQGRLAGVYKALHHLGQVVAIKVLPPSKAKDPNLFARFQRESRLALRLKHPNVVRTFQVGQDQGLHYLVMEHLEGETLQEVLERRKKLPPAEAVRLVHQALAGLQHIHEQGLVHRDLKPANLMLVPARQPGQPDTTLRCTL
ncbi:MAG TPA: serine/threonine-protein kinase, partial [Gemmataceae bacterium]|nr:serine/threonine-protein kinase [Gemmataceae bacterium]